MVDSFVYPSPTDLSIPPRQFCLPPLRHNKGKYIERAPAFRLDMSAQPLSVRKGSSASSISLCTLTQYSFLQ